MTDIYYSSCIVCVMKIPNILFTVIITMLIYYYTYFLIFEVYALLHSIKNLIL